MTKRRDPEKVVREIKRKTRRPFKKSIRQLIPVILAWRFLRLRREEPDKCIF